MKSWIKKIFKSKYLLIAVILIIAFLLRVYNLSSRTVFGADQEWFAYRAKDLLSGDLALLGPVMSVGNFSIGPGFVYLWGLIAFIFNGNPISGAILSVLLGVLTLFIIYKFVRDFVDEKVAFIILIVTSVSVSLIFWDQNPWNPSLFYLSQIILLYGTYISNKKQIGLPIIIFGIILGFQSHLGIILSILSTIVYLIIVRPVRPQKKFFLISIAILFLGFLPNIVFDLKNNFVNIKRLLSIFSSQNDNNYYTSIGKIFRTLLSGGVSIFYPRNKSVFDAVFSRVLFAGVIANAFRLVFNKKYKNLSLLLLITLFLPPLIFFIWQVKFSEYYLMMSIPSFIFLFALLVDIVKNKKKLIIVIISFSLLLNLKYLYEYKSNRSLKDKMLIAQEIINIGGKEDYGISINSELGDRFGFRYIFDYYNIKADMPPKKDQIKIFTIALPDGYQGINGFVDYGGIGLLWQGI